jgi:inner membrane protein
MEPLAHTLAGACLAESGLKRLTPLATSTLLIAANIPDVDGACYAHSADLAFAVRRGLTHGVLAMALLPVLLTAAMLWFDRAVRQRWNPCEAPARGGPLLALAYLGVLSHSGLDWLNNYGVRLLMPFSDRWFYGDALFIVDPWLWLILGGAVMLAWTTHRPGVVMWLIIGIGTTGLLVVNPLVPSWARVTWMVALVAWGAARLVVPEADRPKIALAAVALAAAYIGVMIAGSRIAESQARAWAASQGLDVRSAAAMPSPAEPLRRVVILLDRDRYVFVPVTWTAGVEPGPYQLPVAVGRVDTTVAAALEVPFIQGARRWLRFPSYEVQPLGAGGRRVIIRDARFMVGNLMGYGVVAIVDFDAHGQARPGPRLAW